MIPSRWDNDPHLVAYFRERFRCAFPDAEVHPYEDAGHYVLEDAGPEIAQLVTKFLERVAPEKLLKNYIPVSSDPCAIGRSSP